MLSLATKMLMAISVAALALALGYGIAVSDQAGVALLVVVSMAAGLLSVVFAVSRVRDLEADDVTEVAVAGPSGPSMWPMVTGAAVAVLAAGAATGASLVIVGLLAVTAALAGWFAQAWTEHPSWTDDQSARVSDRLITPLALPVGVIALVAVVVISFSRVLLALPNANVSTAIALVAAVAILGGCWLIAERPSLGSSALSMVVAVAAVGTVAAGVAGAMAGEREFGHEAAERGDEDAGTKTTATTAGAAAATTGAAAPASIEMRAENLVFDRKEVRLAAGEDLTIEFENADALPHNVAIHDGGTVLFAGEIFSGPGSRTYKVKPLKAGRFAFRCDVHPTMKGSVIVS